MDWPDKRILVTGGASFIGRHLIGRLLDRGATFIRVVDDFSSGELANVEQVRGYLDRMLVGRGRRRAEALAPTA